MPRRKKSSQNQSRSSLSINKDKPQQRYAANARERARMRVLSRAFCRLKTTLPWVPADTKLSKLDTLRLASSYIAHLKGILRDETLGSSENSLHPAMSLTWPFGFNRPLGGSGSQEGGSILGTGSEDEDDEELEDMDDEDVGSISSCTWEEVSPPAKDCIHLDSSGKGKARGKASSNTTNSRQVRNKKEISSPSSNNNLNKQNVKSEDFSRSNNNCNTSVRPLSQTQHNHPHHHQQQQHHHTHPQHQQHQDHLHNNNNEPVMFHHFEPEIKPTNISSSAAGTMMAVTNLENAPPHLHGVTLSPQNEILVGVGNPGGMGNNSMDSFLSEINGGSGFTTQISHHHHHHINHGGNEMHHHAPQSMPFGFGSNDLISIG